MTTLDDKMQIIVENKCPSSSGKSELSYHVGHDDKGELYFRVYRNSGRGYFSQEWKSLSREILPLLQDANYPITGYLMIDLYPGVSINSGFFLLVCLLNEGIVERWKRIYKLNDIKPFMAKIKVLIDAKDDGKAVTPKKKSTPKKKKTPTAPASTPL